MTRPDHDGKQAGGEQSEWAHNRAVLHCRYFAFTSELSIRDLLEEAYALGFAAGIEAAAKECHRHHGFDDEDRIVMDIRALRPLPPPKDEKP